MTLNETSFFGRNRMVDIWSMAMNPVCPDEAQYPEVLTPDVVPNLSSPRTNVPQGGSEGKVEPEDRVRLKTKLVSAWNNVKYGGWSMKSKPRFSKTSPLFLLGHSYQLSRGEDREHFRRAFSSLLWLTYRRGFPQLDGSSLTTDCGWGCMLRSGQMLLAQGLQLHLLPAGWTWPASAHHLTKDDMEVPEPRQLPVHSHGGREGPKPRRKSLGITLGSDSSANETVHRQVASWFGDWPCVPFGVHQLVELGKSSGKKAGDWYGPSNVAHILRKAVAASEVPGLVVYVAQDCTVYTGDVMRLCESSPGHRPGWNAVIILVPVRLGGNTLNPNYIECVKNVLKLKCCIGIIGGKPKHSLFFVGFQDEQLFYLDPHYCQSVVDVSQDNFPLESYHCKSVMKMPFSRMDPSCTIGFYAKSQKDFESLCSAVSTALTSSTEKYPIFTFVDGHGQDEGESEVPPIPMAHIMTKGKLSRANQRSSIDDFVLL